MVLVNPFKQLIPARLHLLIVMKCHILAQLLIEEQHPAYIKIMLYPDAGLMKRTKLDHAILKVRFICEIGIA